MDAVLAREVGKKLCAAWGFDVNTVSSIRVDLNGGDIARVTVEFVRLDVNGGLVKQLVEYDLVERPTD